MNILSTIYENLYYTLIYENRYMYFLKGLLNTLIMAFFACIIGIVLGIILAIIIDYNEKTKKLPFLSFLSKIAYDNIPKRFIHSPENSANLLEKYFSGT